jgi:hypothetical protein
MVPTAAADHLAEHIADAATAAAAADDVGERAMTKQLQLQLLGATTRPACSTGIHAKRVSCALNYKHEELFIPSKVSEKAHRKYMPQIHLLLLLPGATAAPQLAAAGGEASGCVACWLRV